MKITLDSVIWDLYKTPIELLMIFFLIGFGIYFGNQNPLNSIVKAHLEVACTHGGYTKEDINSMKSDLQSAGFNPDKITINISPENAVNVTSTNYAGRSSLIKVNVEYDSAPLISTLFKKIGAENNIKYKCFKEGMSEGYN